MGRNILVGLRNLATEEWWYKQDILETQSIACTSCHIHHTLCHHPPTLLPPSSNTSATILQHSCNHPPTPLLPPSSNIITLCHRPPTLPFTSLPYSLSNSSTHSLWKSFPFSVGIISLSCCNYPHTPTSLYHYPHVLPVIILTYSLSLSSHTPCHYPHILPVIILTYSLPLFSHTHCHNSRRLLVIILTYSCHYPHSH